MTLDFGSDADGDRDIAALRRERSGRLPVDWDDWSLDRRADWLQQRYNRIALMELLLASVGVEPTYQASGAKEILTTEELAKLYLVIEGVK